MVPLGTVQKFVEISMVLCSISLHNTYAYEIKVWIELIVSYVLMDLGMIVLFKFLFKTISPCLCFFYSMIFFFYISLPLCFILFVWYFMVVMIVFDTRVNGTDATGDHIVSWRPRSRRWNRSRDLFPSTSYTYNVKGDQLRALW